MIKKLCKNISVIIVGIILITMAFRVGRCSRSVDRGKPETVYITDTLDYEYPDYVEKPGLIFKFTHKSIPPRSVQPVAYQEWMDSVYAAISTVVKNGTMEIIGKRGTNAHKYTYDDVPPNHEIYGTEIGFNVIKHRFKNPFSWSGISIGTRIYYDRMVVPYLETGIRIKKLNINVGIDKHSIYADVSYNVW